MAIEKEMIMKLEGGQLLYNDLRDRIENLKDKKADAVYISDNTVEAIKTFPDGADDLPMALLVGVEPVQDLHGQDNPYPGGGSKNLLKFTIDGTKAQNTSGTWSGNTYTNNGRAFKLNTIDGYSVSSVNISGTPSSGYPSLFSEKFTLPVGSYILSKNIRCRLYKNDTQIADTTTGDYTFNSDNASDEYNVSLFAGGGEYTGEVWAMIRPSSVSDATFVPYSNICHISGWTGANVRRTGKNLFGNGNQTITTAKYIRCNLVQPLAAGDYAVSAVVVSDDTDATTCRIGFYNSSEEFLGLVQLNRGTRSSDTVTLGDECTYITLYPSDNAVHGEGDSATFTDIQIEKGTTASTYEAYQCETYSITFPTSAGTVYGGTLTVNKDGSGELVVDRASVVLENLSSGVDIRNYGMQSNYARVEYYPMRTIGATLSKYACDKLESIDGSTNAPWQVGRSTSSTDVRCFISLPMTVESQADATNLLNELKPQIVYKLATPITYTFTASQIRTLLGQNNIWADTGDIEELTYPADTKLYVDKVAEMVSASHRLMELIITANREDSMKATKAYSSGNLIIVNGTLYRATTGIANNADLTVGTNVTATTVANELASLA